MVQPESPSDASSGDIPEAFKDELRSAWHRYVDLTASLRPALHGYCRKLTRDLWDAEDLVQDTLLRSFGTLGSLYQEVQNPRAYLFRIATNLWIDTLRRRETEAAARGELQAVPRARDTEAGAVRDSGATLLQRLSPQERAAVVLKDTFEFSLEEIGGVLGTTKGAVKAALHRGRERLREPEGGPASRRPLPAPEQVDQFVAAYNARDFEGLLALMLENAEVANVGCGVQFGREAYSGPQGWFATAIRGHSEWPKEMQYEGARMESAIYEGEPIVLGFTVRRGVEALEQVIRLEQQEGGFSRLRAYAFCPETMRAVAEALGLKLRTGLYRFPTPEPGAVYRKSQ